MLNESPITSSLRSHLNCSQARVEQAIASAFNSVQAWLEQLDDSSRWRECVERVNELKATLDDHIARMAGEGVLEDAVTRHPSLYPTMRELEEWQVSLVDKVLKIANDLRRWSNSREEALQISQTLQDFRREFSREEREERHLVDRGLT